MPHYVVLYGGKVTRSYGGQPVLDRDTQARCQEALAAAREKEAYIIFSVDKMSFPYLRELTIAHLRAKKQKTDPDCKLIEKPVAHNSRGETSSAIEILKEAKVDEVTIVSSWYHIPRLRMLWWMMGYRGKKNFRAATHATHPFRSVLREVVAIPENFIMVLISRLAARSIRKLCGNE